MRPFLYTVLFALLAGPASAQVDVAVSTDRATYTTADTVRVAVTATNTADTTVTLHFDTGLQAAFEVGGQTGPFYCAFTQEPTELTLAPGEAHTWGGEDDDRPDGGLGCYDLVLNDEDDPDVPPAPDLGPGTYALTGYVLEAGGGRYGTAETSFTVVPADSLDWRGYFPLAVGNEWEYRVTSEVWPIEPPTTRYRRIRVLAPGEHPGVFAVVQDGLSDDGALLRRDTTAARYDAETAAVLALYPAPDGEGTYEGPLPFFARDLDAPFGEGESDGRWIHVSRADAERPDLFGEGTMVSAKSFDLQGAYYAAVHGVGVIGGGVYGDGCSFDCYSEDWTLTYARVDGVEYGARAVASAPPPAGPAGVGLAVAPNPTGGPVRVAVRTGSAGPVTVGVYDAVGRRVAVLHNGPLGAGETALDFDASALPAGLYLVRVKHGATARTAVFTVAR